MSLLNEKGELNKGLEILVRQILKMMSINPDLVVGQITGISEGLKSYVENQEKIIRQNDEMLQLLKGKSNAE